jgi:type VI secretion system protein ImpK
MSDRDRPFDPFGWSDHAILRPERGSRRATPASPAAPLDPFAAPLADPFMPWPGPPYPAQPPPYPLPPQPSATGVPQPQEGSAARAFLQRRNVLAVPSKSPFIDAAGPLLLLLGRFRANIVRLPSAPLMEEVARAIQDFEQELRALGFAPEQVRAAKYAVAATVDDIVQNIPVEDRRVWTQYSMLGRFFGEGRGGLRFFDELNRAEADPVANYALLELMHACLALGFEGIHRTSAGGAALLQQIQGSLYETLRRVRPRPTHEFSPRWRGKSLPAPPGRTQVPFWAAASVTGVLLLAIYISLDTLLGNRSEVVADALLGLVPQGEVIIERSVTEPPPPLPPPPEGRMPRAE